MRDYDINIQLYDWFTYHEYRVYKTISTATSKCKNSFVSHTILQSSATHWTSVSETIRKAPARRSPKCIRKTRNTFCGNSVKNCFPTKTFTEIGRLLSYGQKRHSIWRPSAILNLRVQERVLWIAYVWLPIGRQ